MRDVSLSMDVFFGDDRLVESSDKKDLKKKVTDASPRMLPPLRRLHPQQQNHRQNRHQNWQPRPTKYNLTDENVHDPNYLHKTKRYRNRYSTTWNNRLTTTHSYRKYERPSHLAQVMRTHTKHIGFLLTCITILDIQYWATKNTVRKSYKLPLNGKLRTNGYRLLTETLWFAKRVYHRRTT